MTALAIAWCIIGAVTFIGVALESILMKRSRVSMSDIWALPLLFVCYVAAGALLYPLWQVMQIRNEAVTWTIDPRQLTSMKDVERAYAEISGWIEKTKDYTYPKGRMV